MTRFRFTIYTYLSGPHKHFIVSPASDFIFQFQFLRFGDLVKLEKFKILNKISSRKHKGFKNVFEIIKSERFLFSSYFCRRKFFTKWKIQSNSQKNFCVILIPIQFHSWSMSSKHQNLAKSYLRSVVKTIVKFHSQDNESKP